MAFHEWLRMQELNVCRGGILKLLLGWGKCSFVVGVCIGKYSIDNLAQ
jgi:hypothetical protein